MFPNRTRQWRGPSLKAFYWSLALGYLANGLVVVIFFLVGSHSGWSFSGDSAGAIGMVYAATLFLPHLALFFFAFVNVTVGSFIFWKQIPLPLRAATLVYLLFSLLILAANLTDNGGSIVHYYARKFFAPSYYDPPRPEALLRKNPALRKLAGQMNEAADRYYKNSDPKIRNDLEIYLDFLYDCAQTTLQKSQKDEYDAYRAARSLQSGTMLRHVHSLSDAIVEERYEYRYRPYPTGERIDKALETMVKEGYCGKVHDFESFRRSFYRKRENLDRSLSRWEFDRKLDTRDILPWDDHTLLVADGARGAELWEKEHGKWHYAKTLDDHFGGAVRIARHGAYVDVYYASLERPDDAVAHYRYDPDRRALIRLSQIDIDGRISFKDWSSDASGEHLFLAGGYSYVIRIDWPKTRGGTVEKHHAGSRYPNDWANDVAWSEETRRLYLATSHGVAFCDDDSFDEYGANLCDTLPVAPHAQGLLTLPGGRLLVVSDANSSALLRLFESNDTKLRLLRRHMESFSLKGSHDISVAYPQTLLRFEDKILLPNAEAIEILHENLSSLGCLDTGKFFHFAVFDNHTLLLARGKKGIDTLDWSRRVACDTITKTHQRK